MIAFYYVRHGETIFNVTGKSQGACDSPLTAKGIQQAENCAEKLKGIRFDKVFSSSSERALDTAEIICKGRDLTIRRMKGLKEMSFGLLEGSGPNDGDQMYHSWVNKDFTSFGGENRKQLIDRIKKAFEEIVSECDDEDEVLIVSHRGYFFYMLEALFGKGLDVLEKEDPHLLEHLIPNASVAKFHYDGVYHLDELPDQEGLDWLIA